MKAKIRKTGEIVDIIYYNNFDNIGMERSSYDFVSYIDSNGVEHDREHLNYYWDFEIISTQDENITHWQEVRERAAIAAMQGLLSCSKTVGSVEDFVDAAVDYANKLVEKLKKK